MTKHFANINGWYLYRTSEKEITIKSAIDNKGGKFKIIVKVSFDGNKTILNISARGTLKMTMVDFENFGNAVNRAELILFNEIAGATTE